MAVASSGGAVMLAGGMIERLIGRARIASSGAPITLAGGMIHELRNQARPSHHTGSAVALADGVIERLIDRALQSRRQKKSQPLKVGFAS